MKLTDAKIRNAKPGAKKTKLFDGGGLYLLVQPNGSKLWRWDYYLNGKYATMSFGSYPEVTLGEARDKHADGRKLLRNGINPAEQRRADKVVSMASVGENFEAVAQSWHEKWSSDKNPDYAADVKLRLIRDVFPAIGHLPISMVKAPAIVALIKKIEQRGAREIASRTLQNIGQVFRYAIAHGLVDRNPATDIKPADILKAVPVTNMARVDTEDLPTLLRKMKNYKGTVVTRLVMKLMALTFVRTSEMIEGEWTEINFKKKLWTIPAERMKQVRGVVKMQDHLVPLSEQALDVLVSLREITGDGEFMFPHQWDKARTMSKNTILEALYRMGYKGEMTGHGFRGIAATILNGEWPTHHPQKSKIIDLQLAHMPRGGRKSVGFAYDKADYLKERVEMMQWWSDYLESARRQRLSLVAKAV